MVGWSLPRKGKAALVADSVESVRDLLGFKCQRPLQPPDCQRKFLFAFDAIERGGGRTRRPPTLHARSRASGARRVGLLSYRRQGSAPSR